MSIQQRQAHFDHRTSSAAGRTGPRSILGTACLTDLQTVTFLEQRARIRTLQLVCDPLVPHAPCMQDTVDYKRLLLLVTGHACLCSGPKHRETILGWAAVVASDEHYQMWWSTQSSMPERIHIEATDMMQQSRSDPSMPENVTLTLPFEDVWPYIGVKGPKGEAEATDLGMVDARVDATGDSYRDFDNNTLTVLFSGRDNPDRGLWWNQGVTVQGALCPPEGCPAPEAVVVERDGPLRCATEILLAMSCICMCTPFPYTCARHSLPPLKFKVQDETLCLHGCTYCRVGHSADDCRLYSQVPDFRDQGRCWACWISIFC